MPVGRLETERNFCAHPLRVQEMFPGYLLRVKNKTFLTKTKTKHKHLSCWNIFIEFENLRQKYVVYKL